MEDIQEKFNRWKAVRMDEAKKRAIKGNLVAFMHANPILEAFPARIFFLQRHLAPLAFAALIILVGSGSSIAAENAVPGDALYSLKINFNEPLIGSLAFSSDEKASWQTELVERRLEEADKLALSGNLSLENQSQLGKNFEDSAKSAEEKILALRQSGNTGAAAKISGKLESSLKAHDQILAELSPKKESGVGVTSAMTMSLKADPAATEDSSLPDGGDPHEKMRGKIKEALDSISKVRGETEVKISAEKESSVAAKAANAKISAAGNYISQVEVYLLKNAPGLKAEILADARIKLETASKLLQTANLKMEAKSYGEAFQLASRALRRAQETKVLAAAQVKAESGSKKTEESRAGLNFFKSTAGDMQSDEDVIMNAAAGSSASVSSTERRGEKDPAETSPNIQLNVNGELEAE